jgi:hypothetical protein
MDVTHTPSNTTRRVSTATAWIPLAPLTRSRRSNLRVPPGDPKAHVPTVASFGGRDAYPVRSWSKDRFVFYCMDAMDPQTLSPCMWAVPLKKKQDGQWTPLWEQLTVQELSNKAALEAKIKEKVVEYEAAEKQKRAERHAGRMAASRAQETAEARNARRQRNAEGTAASRAEETAEARNASGFGSRGFRRRPASRDRQLDASRRRRRTLACRHAAAASARDPDVAW